MKAIEFEEMKKVDIRTVELNILEDLDKIEVDKSLTKEERLLDFITKIKNPFCFICNGMVVKTSYSNTKDSLEDKLVQLCLNMEVN
ncbi:MAG: hypothetical protein EOM40_15420 [Clostridia bacterium]|nr:hypothetical protein [Clostridia bacterium]